MTFNRSLSLEQLEGKAWSDHGPSTRLVLECHRLRKVPLAQLTVEDLRLLLRQQIGILPLTDLALEHLEHDPWCCGDHYPGDLLMAVLHVDAVLWTSHPELRAGLDAVVLGVRDELRHRQEIFAEQILPAWQAIYGE